MENRSNNGYDWVLIALIIVLVLILYTLSFGSFNPEQFRSRFDELKESLEKAKHRNKRLKALIDKKVELKLKLARRFRRIYFTVRLILVLLWFAVLYGLYGLGLLQDHWDALNYSELMLFGLVLFNFITFGTLTNLDKFLGSIKTRVENRVYGKYVRIEDFIEEDQIRVSNLDKQITAAQTELDLEIAAQRPLDRYDQSVTCSRNE